MTASFERTKPPPSKWFVAPGPERKNSHWKPTHGPVPPLHRGCDRDRLRRRVLDVHLEMVLEVLPDARQVVDDVDAEGRELVRVADPRELEELRRVDRPAAEDHLAGPHDLRPPAVRDLDTGRPGALEEHARDEGPAAHVEVRPAPDGMEVGARGAQPPAAGGCSGRTAAKPS